MKTFRVSDEDTERRQVNAQANLVKILLKCRLVEQKNNNNTGRNTSWT